MLSPVKQRDDEGEAARQLSLALMALAAAVSLVAIWQISGSIVLAGALGAGLVLVGCVIWFVSLRTPARAELSAQLPDWSVTRLAADNLNAGLAIIDRAGRLVCANRRFADWFPDLPAPPGLPFDAGARDILAEAGRSAWRDGEGYAAGVKRGVASFDVKVQRAGAGGEYLIWLIDPLVQESVAAEAARMISGALGHAMGNAGIMAVAIGPEGRLRAANGAFAARADGDAAANITNRDFASFLRVDEKNRIYFEREGRRGGQLRLLHAPFDPADEGGAALVLLIADEGGGLDRQSEVTQVENLLMALPIGLAMVDRDGRFLFSNEAFGRLVGHAHDRLPTYPGDLVVREDKSALADTIRRHTAGPPHSSDLAVRLKDQPDEVVALSATGIRGLGDAAVLLALKDTGEESRLKRQVAQATKMQAVGQLAGGVAHDFNNILTAILGCCDLMLLRHSPGDSDYDDIQQIRSNSNRAASLTRQLLAFSRQQTLRPQVLQLPDVVSEVSSLLKRLLGENVRLDVSHGRNIGPVRADPGQLEQVIVNLAVNGRDAMPAGGTLTIETGPVSAAQVRAMQSDILPVADYALLSVRDTGQGIPRENLGKIFEPFFTTKDVGKGTGLGLSTVYGIVKQSGGFIFADSPRGGGARFDIYLPVHRGDGRPAKVEKSAKPAEPRPDWGTGTILLVEDEDMVRTVAQRALERQGYSVETACDGEEALALLAAGKAYDLIVSDVVMPNMDGPAMARELRKTRPDMRIVFMSGYAEEQLRKSIDIDHVWFLPKPFSVQQIADAVAHALNGDMR